MAAFRVGHGYDVHVFCTGRELILGGVTIPYIKGLHGHSDADGVTHAVCDAILGAAGLRDIGCHFPDDDPRFEGINSLKLLARVIELITEKGYRVENVDVTVIAEKPKIQPHVPAMREKLGEILRRSGGPGEVNIKARTNEGLGPIGRGEGIECHAVVLLTREDG
ncbi:2-C-methyl-D-erythritol 2,4-cyclodiphosphate synthase [bacterium]|nr:2-C-methyl-D-erythritol 2,4-cyclodiphosphate synthase [bacterium]